MNKFARAFVFANRLFGAFTTAAGGLILLGGVLRVVLRGTFESIGWVAIGLVLVAVGILYLKAPLLRTKKQTRNGHPSASA